MDTEERSDVKDQNGARLETGMTLQQQPTVIPEGLKLKLEGNVSPLHCFSYALFPTMTKSVPVDWQDFITEEQEAENIRLYNLAEGGQLPDILSGFKQNYAKASVLINTVDNFELPKEFLVNTKEVPFPVFIIKKSDGIKILSYFELHEGNNIQACVEAENEVDRSEQQVELQASKVLEPAKLVMEEQIENRDLDLFDDEEFKDALDELPLSMQCTFSGKSQDAVKYLEDVVTKLMFGKLRLKKSKAVAVSMNKEKFGIIMGAFRVCEIHGKACYITDNYEVIRKLKNHVNAVLKKDFPFYIFLVYQMVMKNYLCKDFIKNFLQKFEELTPEEIAKTLIPFLARFFLAYDNKHRSVFFHLEHACFELGSASPKPYEQPEMLVNFIYPRMLWVSIALKCYHFRGEKINIMASIWRDYFTRFCHKIVLDSASIEELKKGLEIGRLLNLPHELSCNCDELSEFIAVRPFKHLKDCIVAVETYVPQYQLSVMLVTLRAAYETYLSPLLYAWKKVNSICEDGSVHGCLKEGIKFVDSIYSILVNRGATKESIEMDIEPWLKLLLHLIDFTGSDCVKHLKLFVNGKEKVFAKNRKITRTIVVEAAKESLHKLTVQQFYDLYNSSKIWGIDIVNEYLEKYLNSRRELIDLNDPKLKLLFDLVLVRFKSTEGAHRCIIDFLLAVGRKYLENSRHVEFLIQLLNLDISVLSLEKKQENTVEENEIKQLRIEFSDRITRYIIKNNLNNDFQSHISKVMNSISQQHSILKILVLKKLSSVLIPDFTYLSTSWNSNIMFLLNQPVKELSSNLQWLQNLAPRQVFSWGIVSSCCSQIKIADDKLLWAKCSPVIHDLGQVFQSYMVSKKRHKNSYIINCDDLPKDISGHSSQAVKAYFGWIAQIQHVFKVWQSKFEGHVTYNEMVHYSIYLTNLRTVAEVVYCTLLLVKVEDVQNHRRAFLDKFNYLNKILLLHIPEQPDAGWYSLPALLRDYGILLPEGIQEVISSKVFFPGQEGQISKKDLATIPYQGLGMSQDSSLRLHQKMTMIELSYLVRELDDFQHSLPKDLLKMFVFFKLNKNVLFDKYLRHSLSRICGSQSSTFNESYEPNFDDLVEALTQTSKLVKDILAGSATYSEIVTIDEQMLQQLKIEKEFRNFLEYSALSNLPSNGLKGVQNIMQFFQYAAHIENIKAVCEQYHMTACIHDPEMMELLVIVEQHSKKEDRSTLTLARATEMVQKAKEKLCHNDKSMKSLDIFNVIRDSTAFYQFVKDKQFYGSKGQATFYEQHQLITAQLQHEEYDEQVLNHLVAAFKIISPFMDEKKTFPELMREVTALNAEDAVKQLKTVNYNITLIRLWFSRAEGDTLENVAQDLSSILKTGSYTFQLKQETGQWQIFLKYQPSTLQLSAPVSSEGDKESSETQTKERQEMWNSEQIGDFVRKLGFVDKDREKGEERITHFLHFNQTVAKLLELYNKLSELGNPRFLQSDSIAPVMCSAPKEEVEGFVLAMELLLTNWNQSVSDLRARYPWLLYFSIPKTLLLYKLMHSYSPEKLTEVIHEISFLVTDKTENVVKEVENTLQAMPSKSASDVATAPMQVVGHFLDIVLKNCTASEKPSVLASRGITQNATDHYTQPLYYSPASSQMDCICLILKVLSGVPESYQLLRCQAMTTAEELNLFLKRVETHHKHYLMLDVNKLPFELQDILVQAHLGRMHRAKQQERSAERSEVSIVHFVETVPSMLREMPWIVSKDSKVFQLPESEAKKECKKNSDKTRCYKCTIVYGAAGNGKTHFIKKELTKCSEHVTIAINEAFTPLDAIMKLRSLPLQTKNVGLFFNFTMQPEKSEVVNGEANSCPRLIDVIGWFFFDLLLLGYVEDFSTGLSFCFPKELEWKVYVEVPSRSVECAEKTLELFYSDLPALQLVGTSHCISSEVPYDVNSDVQLVCKYLRAYQSGQIDRLYREQGPLVKFSCDSDLSDEECQRLLKTYMPKHIALSKITQHLFIRYMKRRCEFLDEFFAYNLNSGHGEAIRDAKGNIIKGKYTDTRKLGSTLMKTMISEVGDFCDPSIKENWSLKAHQQLIYDFSGGGASIGLISLEPEGEEYDKEFEEEKKMFRQIGIETPTMLELKSRLVLDSYLSRALNIKLEEQHLTVIDDCNYVLTVDYTIKMLNIHERYKCGVPVIIEGETGVGKTALVETLSKLWNHSLLLEWKKQRSGLFDFFKQKIQEGTISDDIQDCLEAFEGMSTKFGKFNKDSLLLLCKQSDSKGKFYSQIRQDLLQMGNSPVVQLLEYSDEAKKNSIEMLFEKLKKEDSPHATAHLLYAILTAQVKPTFHKINVHAAMTPDDVKALFEPIIDQAKDLKGRQATKDSSTIGIPFVTVFLDEVNTSSCLGLFKEIIVDKTFGGEALPENIFIVAACNPHRGNSLAFLEDTDNNWMRGTYNVQSLHPTLRLLLWDYGSLDRKQELDYINEKMKMINRTMPNLKIASLTDLIATSQQKMRDFAFDQLLSQLKARTPEEEKMALLKSRSCVSQRDIQRVFTFYKWFKAMYDKFKPHGSENGYDRRAVMVALGLVYYMRLNAHFRKQYEDYLNKINKLPTEISFTTAFTQELEYYTREMELPKGIARTVALKENLFAIIICTVTHTPLIIVGAPGSSKTLSFNQTIANLKGQESKNPLFRNTEIFHSLDPHYYQCSRRTTSNEIQTVFSRAINRQRSHLKFNLPIYCVVFMDEAGLPEESHESLKVLHYHLDEREVSFVAITNHMLDAAKTNRAVSLFRPKASEEDLETLARGCVSSNPDVPPPSRDVDKVVELCQPYSDCMKITKKAKSLKSMEFSSFFGLRDFIQFVNYIRRKLDKKEALSQKVIMEALERNFNGFDDFEKICKKFLQVEDLPYQRHILEVLKESMADRPQIASDLAENEVRYKLLIDPSEDDSLVRQLFSFGVLDRANTRIFMCSDFPGDGQLQKINTIAAIRHSAIQGHTVIMSQTDSIHESFYDLFNQRFRRIDDPEQGARFYTNIAIGAHSKPSRVDPNFQCIVVVKKSEIEDTPAPFLNRFEKYQISHKALLEASIKHLPPAMATLITTARYKVAEFVSIVEGAKSLYGLKSETTESVILDMLPPLSYTYTEPQEESKEVNDDQDIRPYIVQKILNTLRNNAGFHISESMLDLETDIPCLFHLVECDLEFSGLLQNWKCSESREAVLEAFEILYSDEKKGQLHLSLRGCLIVALLQQLFVRLFTKRLMNLMTAEAVILHRNKIPHSYLKNYINCNVHFSLKEVIVKYHALQLQGTNSPNKLVCFTRSSPLIHAFPAQFPRSASSWVRQDPNAVGNSMSQFTLDDTESLSSLVFPETRKLILHKLSGLQSQSSVQEVLEGFMRSETAEVCVLLANMEETPSKTINHIRVMIEEIERETKSSVHCCKVFALLLHFPPDKFFQHCYPALSLNEWDHCYLDTVAHGAEKGVVDIKYWFLKCCLPAEITSPDEADTFLEALKLFLPQLIPILSARVSFGNKNDGSFNSVMNATERTRALEYLLFQKGLGDVLCNRFRSYWKPSVMVEYMERAARFSKEMESTLNITDTIQTQVKTLFVDFCVYMLTRANENFNLDIAYTEDNASTLHRLFISIIKVWPVRELDKLKEIYTQPCHQLSSPHFPFFSRMYERLENLVSSNGKVVNLQQDVLADDSDETEDSSNWQNPSISSATKLQKLIEAVMNDLEPELQEHPQDMFSVTIQAMASDENLWKCYFMDFITFKLKLISSSDVPQNRDIAHLLLDIYFDDLHSKKMPQKLVELHCHASIEHLSLAQMATNLRPLNRIEMLQPGTSTVKPLLNALKRSRKGRDPMQSPSHLSSFVINTLFNALANSILLPQNKPMKEKNDKLAIWFQAYRDVMAIPAIKQCIYRHCVLDPDNNPSMEGLMNVMQSVFVVLQSSPTLDDSILSSGHRFFCYLFSQYFEEIPPSEMETIQSYDNFQFKSRDNRPGMTEVMDVVLRSGFTARGSTPTRLIVEGLLAHFFSPDRPNYVIEDALWFLELINQQNIPADKKPEAKPEAETHVLSAGIMEISMKKFYLGRILGACREGIDAASGPLSYYKDKFRSLIGEVLIRSHNLGPSAPYIPLFYQHGLDNAAKIFSLAPRMQQPLCHLYFLVVMEHLWSKYHDSSTSRLAALVRIADNIQNLLRDVSPENEKEVVLMQVEFQAVIQMLIQHLATHLDPKGSHKISDCPLVLEDLNKILDNPLDMGGAVSHVHGMVLSLHLLNILDSSQSFLDMMSNKMYFRNSDLRSINCLKTVQNQLHNTTELKPHLFPFFHSPEEELCVLYRRVVESLLKSNGLQDFIQICAENRLLESSSTKHHIFRKILWLAVYYHFYDQKIESPAICEALDSQEITTYFQDKGYVRLLKCFLNPRKNMIHQADETYKRLFVESGHRSYTQVDPIYQLFVPVDSAKLDRSDIDLRHCLANIVAVIVGCPARSNHLWYHLFAPDELSRSYMTGFMYHNVPIRPVYHYDCGLKFNYDGNPVSSSGNGVLYKKALNALYVLLLANFGSFCMGLLTQPGMKERLNNKILSTDLPIRNYCIAQLRQHWIFIKDHMRLSAEQRSFFVMRIMQQFDEAIIASCQNESSPIKGIYKSQQELDRFDNLWNKEVFQPIWEDREVKFIEFTKSNPISKILLLDAHYPIFPSEKELIHAILGGGTQQDGCELELLSAFALEKERLQVGGSLLPDLVKFYTWIHTNLSHLLTVEQASGITIGRVIALAEINMTKESRRHITDLYERVKQQYNCYVKIIGGVIGVGACGTENEISEISDDTSLLHFLSDAEGEEEGNDCLYIIISDIIKIHNKAIDKLYSMMDHNKKLPMFRLVPEEPAKISLLEVTKDSAIVGRFSELHDVNSIVQLMRSRYGTTSSDKLHFDKLEEDVLREFVAGKPIIGDPSQLRSVFQFKVEKRDKTSFMTNFVAEGLSERLPESFKIPLIDNLKKNIEHEFHSADYQLMTEMVTALGTIIGHLVNTLKEANDGALHQLEKEKALYFMINIYNDPQKKAIDILHEIGVQNVSNSHLHCLEDLPLTATHDCLELFLHWVSIGFYDFNTLPGQFKAHMALEDKNALEQLHRNWSGTIYVLEKELNELIDALKLCERDITSQVNERINTPVLEYITAIGVFDEKCQLASHLHPTIMLRHYVELRLSLRKLHLAIAEEVLKESENQPVTEEESWSEQVASLWEEYLPHLRKSQNVNMEKRSINLYGFQEAQDGDKVRNDKFGTALMREMEEGEVNMEQVFGDNYDDEEEEEEKEVAVVSEKQAPDKETTTQIETIEVQISEKKVTEKESTASIETFEERIQIDTEKNGSIMKASEKGEKDISSLACEKSPDDVADFLTTIGLPEYIDTFKEEEIGGEVLLNADPEMFHELGVKSLLHQMRIMELFKRELLGTTPLYSRDHFNKFLSENKLGQHAELLEKHGIDGDMIVNVDVNTMKDILKEIGMTSLPATKICSKYKKYVNSNN